MKLNEIMEKLPPDCRFAMRAIWEGLETAEGSNGPDSGHNYIKLLALVQCEIANRIHTASVTLEEQM